ncbi:MAG: hypothetical protein Q7R77_01175 [Candidatus Daviesbacteria bacterium]|nr:hypothetical protein [Candidatus Daviesbacteria bacterium]
MKILVFWVLLSVLIFLIPQGIIAGERLTGCENRFVTLINPVRGRNLWIDKTVKPAKDQYNLVKEYNFPATWLLQYDVLLDKELLVEINKFDKNQEKGVFLEISQEFAEQARVIYPHSVPWFNPRAVFLSGYSQSDRRKLIDKLFIEFKLKFGSYPGSVGAWWIDSYSLNYMKEKYGIKSAMIVADQKTTDNYGVWGQWWGVPYYPSKINILTPASNSNNKLDVVIIQWAQRDPLQAWGEGPAVSNYSLQANDYIRQGKDIKYFSNLTNVYLDCKNPVGQVTVGLETGIESIGYIGEYEKQLKYLSGVSNIKFVTMGQFAREFAKIFPVFPEQFLIDPNWILKTGSRMNSKLGDDIKYRQDIAFSDFFIADHENFLNRNLQQLSQSKQAYSPYFLLVILMAGIFFFSKKLFNVWITGTLFAIFSFGLILRSAYSMGWQIFYGPSVPFLIFIQVAVVAISYLLMWFFSRLKFFKGLILWFIPLSFGLDFIISRLRFSYFGEKYYFLYSIDSLRSTGFSFFKPFNLRIINQDFPSVISSSLLKVDFAKLWDNLYISLIAYPLLHILLAVLLGYLFGKFPSGVRKILVGLLIVLAILQFINIFQADPRLVQ